MNHICIAAAGTVICIAFGFSLGLCLVKYNTHANKKLGYVYVNDSTVKRIDPENGVVLYYSKHGFSAVGLHK